MNSTLKDKEEKLYKLASVVNALWALVGEEVSVDSIIEQATPDSPIGKLRDEIKAIKLGEKIK